jgi:superfamily II DNA or RNA helicase
VDKVTIHLRSYQEQALAAETLHRIEHPDETRLAIVMATGLGKTIVMAERAVRYLDSFEGTGNRALILVHTDELAQQAEAKVRLVASGDETYGAIITVGVVMAERDETTADIIIGSVQTLANPERRARITDVGLVIVDECHHATAASYQAILRHFGCFRDDRMALWDALRGEEPSFDEVISLDAWSTQRLKDKAREWGLPEPTPALGLTATLERGDGQGLGSVWQNVAFTRDTSWGVRHGYLVQPVGYRLEIANHNFSFAGTWDERTERDMNPRLLDALLTDAMAPEKIVEEWIRLAKDRPTVAFMPLVRSAEALCLAFHNAGISAGVVWGGMNPAVRRNMLQGYEDGTYQVLVNAMVLTEGWDSPRTKCVIVGRPTKSRALFVQMAGRGLRPVPGIPVEEQDCIVLCVADSTTDLCTIADLSDRPLDRKATGALTAMEDAWDIGAALEQEARHWTGKVDAKQFDPLVTRSSKVWRTTKGGTYFLPISKDREYVFVVGTSVFAYEQDSRAGYNIRQMNMVARRLHADLPDLELALSIAEDEAQERGGDLGKLLADKNRAWRKERPSEQMLSMAERLGLSAEVQRIMNARAGGKAGKVSDLISRVQASRALDPMVERIKEATR